SAGHIDVATYLLANGAEVDKVDDSGWTALQISVSAGHEEVVSELVGAGADVNRMNDKGITPLFVSRDPCARLFNVVVALIL
ncbi:hypothetical protein BC826DRAFT_917347, partial [Russula brevipes]